MTKRIYLDYNATTPLDPRVLESMLPYFNEKFGNSSSKNHSYGWDASAAVDLAREQIANLVGAKANNIIFTSGATESNNLGLKGISHERGKHIITCNSEHKAILDPIDQLANDGFEVTHLNIKADGLIDLNAIEKAIKPETFLICIMYANNETGVIQPIREISKIAAKHEVLLMTDATQAVGKIPVDVKNDGIDLMSFSAHKMYGPKGVGALYVKSGLKLNGQIVGGGQEKGRRSGTLNVPGIVGFGKACQLCQMEMDTEQAFLKNLRDELEKELLTIENASLNGNQSNRLTHVTNISFGELDGEKLLLSLKELAISQGSACTSGTFEPSHVLKAMGLTDAEAFGSLRFGLGRFTTKEEIALAKESVKKVVNRLKLVHERD